MDKHRNGSQFWALELKPRLDHNIYSLSVTHHNHHEILHHFHCLMVHCFTALCKKVGGRHFWKFENKQDKIDPKLGFALLNSVYSFMLHNYFQCKACKISKNYLPCKPMQKLHDLKTLSRG